MTSQLQDVFVFIIVFVLSFIGLWIALQLNSSQLGHVGLTL